tara:strand:- start:2719 stop:3384 length:666 start_codon:yes stop_codon:yes gene_type:complete
MAQMIGEILVQKGYVSQQQVDGVLAVKGPDAQVGQVLIEWGLITEVQLKEALGIQAPPPPPPPPVAPAFQQQPMAQQPVAPQAPPQPSVAPDLTMDTIQTSKFKIDLKTMIYIGSLLVSGITMYFTFMGELDARFSSLENKDDSVIVELEKKFTALENKFTPIGEGVYAVDPNTTWPPTRQEYTMKQNMNANMLMEIQKDIEDIKRDIEKIEKKVFNGSGS